MIPDQTRSPECEFPLGRAQAGTFLNQLFHSLPAEAREDLERELELVTVKGGELLIRQGDPGDCAYIVLSGRLRVVLAQPQGASKTLAELGPGQIVGEMALLTGEDRTASVYGIRDTRLARISQASFDRALQKHPLETTRSFARTVVERLRASVSRGAKKDERHLSTIAVVPAAEDVPLHAFAQRLAAALANLAPTLHLTHRRLEEGLGRPEAAQALEGGPSDAAVMDWLADQEATHRYVVYEADAQATPWTRRCVRQADHVLIVGQGGADPAPGGMERELLQGDIGGQRAGQSLALIYGPGQQPANTAAWLAARELHRHYHLRLSGDADFQRLARSLTGRSVALTLGGGGARGLAHIGVIRAMRECGVPIDFVGGTSMGSLIAAQCALEWECDQMVEVMAKDWGMASLMDLTLPAVSLIAGRKLNRTLNRVFGDTRIEDLWTPYFCVSTNLTRAEALVIRDGPLYMGIRASGSVAGVMPPVVHHGDLLVDGAVLNNVPVDVMSEFCDGGQIVAVDVSPPVDLSANSAYGEGLHGHQYLWRKLNPLVQPLNIPGIVAIIQRAQELGSIAHQKRLMSGIADLYLLPPVEEFFLFDFKSSDRIMEIGYRYGLEQIQQWRASQQVNPRR